MATCNLHEEGENVSFGGGFATGIGAGIGAGISIGTSSGRKRSAEALRDYFDTNSLTVLDPDGNEFGIESILDELHLNESCETGCGGSKRRIALMAVLAAVFLAGVVTYILLQK
jgi:hypothetical protein